MSIERTHFRTCHLCEAMCGVAVEVDGGRITSIRGDRGDPFSRGRVKPPPPRGTAGGRSS